MPGPPVVNRYVPESFAHSLPPQQDADVPAAARASAYRSRARVAGGPAFAAEAGPPMRAAAQAFSAPQAWPPPGKGHGKDAKGQHGRTSYAQPARDAHEQPPHQKGGEYKTARPKAGMEAGPPRKKQRGNGAAAQDSEYYGVSFDGLALKAEAILNDLIPDDHGTRMKALKTLGSVTRAMAVHVRKLQHNKKKTDCANTLEEVATAVLPFFDDDDVKLRLAGVQVIAGLGEFAEQFSEYLAVRAEDEDAGVQTVALDAIRNLEQLESRSADGEVANVSGVADEDDM